MQLQRLKQRTVRLCGDAVVLLLVVVGADSTQALKAMRLKL